MTKGYLKYYQQDNELFREETQIEVPIANLDKIAKRIAIYFKFHICGVYVNKKLKHTARAFPTYIEMSNNETLSLYALCHELAHCYLWQRYDYRRHGKKLRRVIVRFLKYCKKSKSIMRMCS